MTETLVIAGLNAHYGPAQALWNVDLTVGPGEVVALLGENGAGKTTLLRALARVHRQATGSARYGELELMNLPPHKVVQGGISMVRDGARVFDNLTIEEHLYLASRIDPKKRAVEEILQKFSVLGG
jgi:branched-chain amino acid transport system ATP-binding protein